jgi:hypothetical protein
MTTGSFPVHAAKCLAQGNQLLVDYRVAFHYSLIGIRTTEVAMMAAMRVTLKLYAKGDPIRRTLEGSRG